MEELALPPAATVPDETSGVSLSDILAAAARLAPFLHHTPLLTSASLSARTGMHLRLKGEHLQKSGSFKSRGALNTLLSLSEEVRARGVVAFSSGNHAQGVALAARLIGIQATIVMPSDAPRVKIEATRGYGAELVLYDRMREDREAIARALAESRGATLVPPFDDPRVIAGQGTIGLEILQDWPELDAVVVPVGGGGLIAGVATALQSLQPSVRIFGVEPEGADDARQSLERGQIVRIEQPRTVADGVATTSVGQHTFPILRQRVEKIVTVTEARILEALELILTRTKQVVEPTGALATAALLEPPLREILEGKNVVAILCGGNLDLRALARLRG